MSKRLGAVTLNWNGERFIYAHLKMLKQFGFEKMIVIQGLFPWADYQRDYNLDKNPDHSEEIIRKYFPEVEIVPACSNEYNAAIYNQGLSLCSDLDLVFRFDYDMFLTSEDIDLLKNIIETTNFDCYRFNFHQNTINYYFDYDHGVKNAMEFDPIAVSPKKQFTDILTYPADNTVIVEHVTGRPTIHHFRGWKGFGMDPKWINNEIPNFEGVYAAQMLLNARQAGWFPCPQEIRNMLEEGKEASCL